MLPGKRFTVNFSFLLVVEWRLPWKLIQTTAESLYNSLPVTAHPSPTWPFPVLFSISFLCREVLWQIRNKERSSLEPFMTPGHQERAGYGHRLSEQLHSGSENQRDPHLPYHRWRLPLTSRSKYRMCLYYSFARCSSVQQLCGVSQSTEQLRYSAKALLPEKRKPIPSVSTVVWREKWGLWFRLWLV